MIYFQLDEHFHECNAIVYEINDAIWRTELTTYIIFTHLSMCKDQCLFLKYSRAPDQSFLDLLCTYYDLQDPTNLGLIR